MFDLVLLLVEFSFTEEVVDGFVILRALLGKVFTVGRTGLTISRN